MSVIEDRLQSPSPRARRAAKPSRARGLTFRRHYTTPGVHPFDEVEWDLRTAAITGEGGETVFRQQDVEIPAFWSQQATKVVVSKYFRGHLDDPHRERSVKQLISRVADTMTDWGRKGGYFAAEADAETFNAELTYLLLHQHMAFNSPVWFNVGLPDNPRPQCSACFINSVEDDMESIMRLAATEARLFKGGSGAGSNLSRIRSSKEKLTGGGIASGPVSFMKGYDAFAGVIKSGGKTRRAAKMVILNVDHPDVIEFVNCKAEEEKKAWALIEAGYDGGFNVPGGAYDSVFFQNANHSVRVTDTFMKAAEKGEKYQTFYVTDGAPARELDAREVLRQIAEATWICGDPGMQFDTTINRWHTCKDTDRIYASNPCVTGDTLVATAEGWQRIDALVGKPACIYGADGQPHFVTQIFPTGRKPVYRLRTRAGFEVRITSDHKVLTQERGDTPVSELRVGDRLLLQGGGFGRRVVNRRLALGIGIAVGDGCLSRSVIAGKQVEVVTLVMAPEERCILEQVADELTEQKRMLRPAGSVGRGDAVALSERATGVSRLSVGSQSVVDLFKQFAVLDEGSDRKRFTPAVFELDRESQAHLLRGLFTADGSVANYGEKSQYIALDSTSLELLQQTQLLLLSFGIKAKIYRERRPGASEALLPDGRGGNRLYPVKEIHSLRISRSSRFIFGREIGFDPASPKADALATLNAEVGAYRDSLSDQIESVELLGEEDVFDLTEPITHHFSANGIIVHNCSEYMFLDDTACNLASLNLMKFRREDGSFDVDSFIHACEVTITAQEIIVDAASYPTERIAENSHDYRPLGLGYANLGALLMADGLPYDSDAGRAIAGGITAVMNGAAYRQSARMAEVLGPFPGYRRNRESMLDVMQLHRDAVEEIDDRHVPADLMQAARRVYDDSLDLGEQSGFRNAQATVLAPTGTIAFMMDCDTTGIEPDIALVKYKTLVGGGFLKIVNQTVPEALQKLGYTEGMISEIVAYIEEHGTIEGAPGLKEEHLPVFDCAFRPANGIRSIHHMGHVKMMAAAQPFLSGAISKTVNVPEEATVEEIADAYYQAWKLGLKAIAIYRDNSKRTQPLSTRMSDRGKEGQREAEETTTLSPSLSLSVAPSPAKPYRRRLPDERMSVTHKFSIAGHEGYIHVGLYEDGTPGEIFVTMSKEGSTISGMMDAFATSVSLALQYGVPLEVLVRKFAHMRFEPSGWTPNPDIPFAKSVMDYIFRWMGSRFLPPDTGGGHEAPAPMSSVAKLPSVAAPPVEPAPGSGFTNGVNGVHTNGCHEAGGLELLGGIAKMQEDAPPCTECGMIMVRAGACYRCDNCGATSGCG